MRRTRTLLSTMAAAALAVALLPLAPQQASAQSTGLTILVAPVIPQDGVDRRFGERIADEIRDALENFAGYTAVDEDDVDDTIDQYDLDKKAMSPIEWRQLAGQMNAALVMLGTATPGTGGVVVDVDFLDPRTGDQLPMEPVTVPDDRSHKQAAQQIMQQLETGVEYGRRIAFCSEYLSTESWSDALSNCNEALALNPGSTRALYLRGRTHMGMEEYGSAVDDLETVVSQEASNTEALQSLAYTHAQLGNADRSLELYREYLNFNPDDVDVRLNVAYNLATAGGYAEAMQILDDGIERDPENVALLEYQAGVAINAGQTNGEVTDEAALRKAVDASEKVIAIRGESVNPTVLTNATSAYMLLEDYEDALAFSDRAIEMINSPRAADTTSTPDEAPTMSKEQLLANVYAARAQIFDRTDRTAEAAAEFRLALQNNPDLPNGHRRLGLFLLKSGQSDAAITEFRTAVQNGANPDEIANALFGQGYNDHFQQGQFQEAIALFTVAAEFAQAPDTSQQIHFFTAFGHYQRGTNIDNANEQAEACQPARTALNEFQQVLPHLNQAGRYQPDSQQQIRDAIDVQLYRQEQIIRSACGR